MVFTLDPVLPLSEGTRSVCTDRNTQKQGLPAPHRPGFPRKVLRPGRDVLRGGQGEERRTGYCATRKELRVGLTPRVVPAGRGSGKSWAGPCEPR